MGAGHTQCALLIRIDPRGRSRRLPELIADELPKQIFLAVEVRARPHQDVATDAPEALRNSRAALSEQGAVRMEEEVEIGGVGEDEHSFDTFGVQLSKKTWRVA